MQEVADGVVLNSKVALVDRSDERQAVHVFERFSIRIMHNVSITIKKADARNGRERSLVSDFGNGEIELLAGYEVDRATT